MKIVSKATQMMKSLYTPFGSLIAVIVFLLVVIAVLRMTGVTIGLGANAHVGRLRGSFAVEGFEEHLWGIGKKKKKKTTSDLGDRANQYDLEAKKIAQNMTSYVRQYYAITGVADTDKAKKNALVAKYTIDAARLVVLQTALAELITVLTEDLAAANAAKDSVTIMVGYSNASPNAAADAATKWKIAKV